MRKPLLTPTQIKTLMFVYATNSCLTHKPLPEELSYLPLPRDTWRTWARLEHWLGLIRPGLYDPETSTYTYYLTHKGEHAVAQFMMLDYPPRNGQD